MNQKRSQRLVITTVLIVFCTHRFVSWLVAQNQITSANWNTGAGVWSNPSNWICDSDPPGGCVPTLNVDSTIANGGAVTVDVNALTRRLDIISGLLQVGGGRSLLANDTL